MDRELDTVTTSLTLPSLLPGTLHENGLQIPADLGFDDWCAALRNAEWIERASPWWVVDLVAFGRVKFGEEYSQALPDAIEDADGFHQAKLRQAEWMADCWPASTRVPDQSYSAHRAVAKLDHQDAVALLRETDRDGRRLTVRALSKRADEIEESHRGRAVTVDGEPIETAELPWVPGESDLTDDARRSMAPYAPQGRHRSAWVSGYIRALVWAEQRDAFIEWKG